MNYLKNFLKSRRSLYLFSLTVLALYRLIKVWFRSFPLASGWSNFDFIPNRKKLIEIRNEFSPVKSPLTAKLIEALEQDRIRIEKVRNSAGRVFPLSFSWPGVVSPSLTDDWEKRENFSKVVPGEPYSFSDYSSYIRQYRNSKFALTIKKGGWDCFRHVEILAAGSIPIMPDICQCPPWAMAFYPKSAMAEVALQVRDNREIDKSFADAIYVYFSQYLTAKAMAGRILEKAGRPVNRVMFLDPHLNSVPEYLAVMSYVGLKQILGRDRVIAPYGAAPIFDDWNGESHSLHGLGFGYTRLLGTHMRSALEIDTKDDPLSMISSSEEDLVVVGSLSRNFVLANHVNELGLSPDRVVFIWGDDRSPDRRELRWLKQLRGLLAFRELYDLEKAAKYLE